jgi:hypothetical protein
MKKHSFLMCLVVAALYAVKMPACAGVLYDNLSAFSLSNDPISGPTAPLSDSFSTGTGAAALTDIKVLAYGNPILGNGGVSAGSVDLTLLADNGTAPGAALLYLGSLSDSALSTSPTVFDVPLATPYNLAANTRYWIELSSSNGTVAHWEFSQDTNGPGVANEFFSFGGSVYPNAAGPYQMQVNADLLDSPTVIPEPSTLASWILLVAAGGFLRPTYGFSRLRFAAAVQT